MVDDDNYRSADNKQRNDSNNLINNVAANDDNSLKYNTRYHDDINIITRKFNDNSSFNINDDYSKFITDVKIIKADDSDKASEGILNCGETEKINDTYLLLKRLAAKFNAVGEKSRCCNIFQKDRARLIYDRPTTSSKNSLRFQALRNRLACLKKLVNLKYLTGSKIEHSTNSEKSIELQHPLSLKNTTDPEHPEISKRSETSSSSENSTDSEGSAGSFGCSTGSRDPSKANNPIDSEHYESLKHSKTSSSSENLTNSGESETSECSTSPEDPSNSENPTEYSASSKHSADSENSSSSENSTNPEHSANSEYLTSLEHLPDQENTSGSQNLASSEHSTNLQHSQNRQNLTGSEESVGSEHSTDSENSSSSENSTNPEHSANSEYLTGLEYLSSQENPSESQHFESSKYITNLEHLPNPGNSTDSQHLVSSGHSSKLEHSTHSEHPVHAKCSTTSIIPEGSGPSRNFETSEILQSSGSRKFSTSLEDEELSRGRSRILIDSVDPMLPISSDDLKEVSVEIRNYGDSTEADEIYPFLSNSTANVNVVEQELESAQRLLNTITCEVLANSENGEHTTAWENLLIINDESYLEYFMCSQYSSSSSENPEQQLDLDNLLVETRQ